MSRLREWHLWRAPVGEPLLRGRLLDMVGALWLSQVATATPKCLYGGLASSLYTSPPHHPPPIPPTPMLCWPYINAHLKKNRLKSTENRPPATNKVSYMKVSRLLCLLLPIQDGQLLAVGCLNWQNILKWYFLKYYQVCK